MKKRIFALLLALSLVLALASPAALAAGNLDEITRYDVTVSLRDDGSADLMFDIDWKVLDSSSEGPLEWVKIGVPNLNIDELTAYSDAIDSMEPYPDGGTYVRLDLDKRYYEGETVNLAFSLHCTHLYEIDQNGIINYQFTPGWFDAAETKNFSLTWQQSMPDGRYRAESNGATVELIDDGQQVSVSLPRLAEGQTVTLVAQYPGEGSFPAPLDPEMTRSNANSHSQNADEVDLGRIFTVLLFTILFIAIICRRFSGDYWLGGFGGWFGGHHHHHHGPGGPGGPVGGGGGGGSFGGFGGGESRGSGAGRRSSSGSSCACACVSCACACACAGGGRAGCSAKDFKRGFSTQKLLNALQEPEKEIEARDE